MHCACLFSLFSCSSRQGAAGEEEGDTVRMKYARNLVMVRYDGYTKVTLKDPWHEGKDLHTYYILSRTSAPPSPRTPGNATVQPFSRTVVFTAAHCQLLCWLHADQAVAGVCDKQYIREATAKGGRLARAADCGDGMSPDIERIVSLHPQALLVSPFENSGGHGALEKTGIPIVETAEYMEPTALGRAEWMKFYGLLYGRGREADSLFQVVDSTYQALCALVRHTRHRPVVLTERKTGSVWYAPGGRSTIAQLISDAGGTHPFAADTHSGSLPLSPETVLAKASDVNVWAFKYAGSKPLTRQQLLGEYHGYKALRAFQTGNIYQCNTLVQPYFDEVSFRPDLLLREFIIILHPELQLGPLRYYTHD